jgi:hypothetical protein
LLDDCSVLCRWRFLTWPHNLEHKGKNVTFPGICLCEVMRALFSKERLAILHVMHRPPGQKGPDGRKVQGNARHRSQNLDGRLTFCDLADHPKDAPLDDGPPAADDFHVE